MVFNIGNSRVIESREVSDGAAIRRRNPDGKRFTTYERVENRNLAVIKKKMAIVSCLDRVRNWRLLRVVRSENFFKSDEEVDNRYYGGWRLFYTLGESEVTSNRLVWSSLDELEKAQWSGVCSFC